MEIKIIKVKNQKGEHVGTEIIVGKNIYQLDVKDQTLRIGAVVPNWDEELSREDETITIKTPN